MRPTIDQVDEQWPRALVKKGLAIDLVDDAEFRKVVLMIARAGLQLSSVDAVKAEPHLAHRTKRSTVCIPAVENKVEALVSKRINGLMWLIPYIKQPMWLISLQYND